MSLYIICYILLYYNRHSEMIFIDISKKNYVHKNYVTFNLICHSFDISNIKSKAIKSCQISTVPPFPRSPVTWGSVASPPQWADARCSRPDPGSSPKTSGVQRWENAVKMLKWLDKPLVMVGERDRKKWWENAWEKWIWERKCAERCPSFAWSILQSAGWW